MPNIFYLFSLILWYKNVRLRRNFTANLIVLQVIKSCTILNFIVSLITLNIFGVIVNLTLVKIVFTPLKD